MRFLIPAGKPTPPTTPVATSTPARPDANLPPDVLLERYRVTSALLTATAELATANEADVIVRQLCETVVKSTPHILLAWVWFGDPDTDVIRPQIAVGPARAYAEALEIHRNWLTLKGPAFQALESQQWDQLTISRLSLFQPWRMAAVQYGFRVAAALPLHLPDQKRRGIVVFYANDEAFFERVGIEPFLSFARLSEVALNQVRLTELLQAQATTDSLTGLDNRRAMSGEIERAISTVRRYGGGFSVVMFDIDHFKRVNDTWGHAAGDEVIIALAQLVRASLRREDCMARWGGEEFLCLLPNSSRETALAVAEKLRQQIESTDLPVSGRSLRITASFGVAGFPDHGDDIDVDDARRMLARADAALYDSKAAGRNRVSG